jgi:hypothetical protein
MKFAIKVIKNVPMIINGNIINFRSCLKCPDEYGVFNGIERMGRFHTRPQAKKWIDSGKAEIAFTESKRYHS